MTYVLSLTNTAPADAKPVLHLLRLDTNQDVEIPNATGGVLRRLEVGRLPGRSERGSRGPRRTRGARRRGPWRQPARVPNPGTRPGGQSGREPRRRRRRRGTSSCAISRPARCSRGRTSSRSPSRPRRATCCCVVARRASGWRGGAARRRRGGGAPGGRRRAAARRPRSRPGPRGADVILHDLAIGTRPAARQRRRHRVQQEGRSARLHRRRRGEGRQRPVRARPAQRPRERARQRRAESTTA